MMITDFVITITIIIIIIIAIFSVSSCILELYILDKLAFWLDVLVIPSIILVASIEMEEICSGCCNVHPSCASSDCSTCIFSAHAGLVIILSSQHISFHYFHTWYIGSYSNIMKFKYVIWVSVPKFVSDTYLSTCKDW